MMTVHMKTASEMEIELQQSFKVFDANGDGFINASELRQAMTTIGEKMTEKDINDIIKQWDSDGDGKIDYKGYFLLLKLRDSCNSLVEQEPQLSLTYRATHLCNMQYYTNMCNIA